MKLQRLSICPCGYSVLDDRIEVGQEYIITSGVMPDFVYVCGNCKLEQRISIVYARFSTQISLQCRYRMIYSERSYEQSTT